MAAETLSSISNALSQTFEAKLERQWNRMAVAAQKIEAKPGRGKNAAWDVEFSGATATTVAEGSDVAGGELSSDVNVPATMAWAHQRQSFKISETEIDAAASSQGLATALEDLFGERIMSSGAAIAAKINADIYSGTGVDGSSNVTLFGLVSGGALDATGIQANINRSTYSEWAGNVLANGGVGRALSQDLLEQADQNIFTASGEDWDYILCSAGVYRKYAGLFTPLGRQAVDGGGPLVNGLGAASQFYKGKPVYRDRNCTAGTLIFVNQNGVEIKYLPRVTTPNDATMMSMTNANGSNGDNVMTATKIPVRIALLAKNGDSITCSLKCSIQMLVKRPNKFALIKDISET